MQDKYLSQNVQTMFDISPQTVRNWAHEFQEYLSPAANPGTGRTRKFTEDDLRVFALIAQMKNEGAVYADIHTELKKGTRGEPPVVPDEMIPIATTEQGLLIINKLQEFENRLQQVENQKDERVYEELDRVRRQRDDLLIEIGKLRARLEIMREEQADEEDSDSSDSTD
jgi:DNA-binding transcriptional MerR regulator